MARSDPALTTVNARILYWGIAGAGKTANLRAVHAKLRPDHRGALRETPTRLDPTVTYETLPIELGDIAGVRTQIEILTVPGAPEQAPTRKQLLDRVDGIVLVVDSQREHAALNLASFEELRSALQAYGRNLDDVPLVIQYNKRDLADPYSLEDLHRKLDLPGAAVFESVATEGTGVLQTLSTISKHVIRTLRSQPTGAPAPRPNPPTAAPLAPPRAERSLRSAPELARPSAATHAPAPAHAPAARVARPAPVSPRQLAKALGRGDFDPEARAVEATALRAEALLDDSWPAPPDDLLEGDLPARWSLVSVGKAARSGERSLRIPLVLGDETGRKSELVLNLSLDFAEDEGGL